MAGRFGVVALCGTYVAATDYLESPAPTPAAYWDHLADDDERSAKMWGDSGDSHSDYCNWEGDASVQSVMYNKEVRGDNGMWVKDNEFNVCWERNAENFGFPSYYHDLDNPDIRFRMVAGLASSELCCERPRFSHECSRSGPNWMRSHYQSCGYGGGWKVWTSAFIDVAVTIDTQGPIQGLYGVEAWSLPSLSLSTPVPTTASLNSNQNIMSWGTCKYENEGKTFAYYGKEMKMNGVWDTQVVNEGYCLEDTTIPWEYDADGRKIPTSEGGTGYPEYWQNQFCCKDSTRFKITEYHNALYWAGCSDDYTISWFSDDPTYEMRKEGSLTVSAGGDCGLGNYRVFSFRQIDD